MSVFDRLPRVHRTGDKLINAMLVNITLLVTCGTLAVASASEGQAAVSGSAFSIMKMQVAWIVVGAIGFWFMMTVPLKKVMRPVIVYAALGLTLVLLAYVDRRGTKVDGARRWIHLPGVDLQPSELFKIATVVGLAVLIAHFSAVIGNGQRLIAVTMPIWCGALLIVGGKDFGTASIVVAISLMMLYTAGVSSRKLVLTMAAGVTFFVLALMTSPFRYVRNRFTAFLHPSRNTVGAGWQLLQSKTGLGAGGLFGMGYGHSREKWGLLPNPHTDFIFAIIGEEMGLIGTLVVMALFVWFLITATKIIQRCPNDVYRLMAVGITTWITVEAIINIASVVGFWAITGVPLPFISYGGTSLVMELSAVGLLCNIAKQREAAPPLVLSATLPPFFSFTPRAPHREASPRTPQRPSRPRY